MTQTIPLLLLPPLLLLWALDAYLFVMVFRLILSKCHTAWASQVCSGLKPLTDPIPDAVRRRLAAKGNKPVPDWLPWLMTFGGGVLLRYLLVALTFGVS